MMHSTSIKTKLERWGREQDETFKKGITKLKEELVVANGLAREANFLSKVIKQLMCIF